MVLFKLMAVSAMPQRTWLCLVAAYASNFSLPFCLPKLQVGKHRLVFPRQKRLHYRGLLPAISESNYTPLLRELQGYEL